MKDIEERSRGNDQGERQGDALRSQGPLRQDQGGREGNPAGQWQHSLDLLGDVLMFFEVHMGMSQLCNVGEVKALKCCHSVEEVVKETIEALVDFRYTDRQRKDRSRPTGEDRLQHQGLDHLQGKETDAEPKKIQPNDQKGPKLEQDLSSLLVQPLMQENEELRKGWMQ